jgi:tetratricopeptide (TPR) repeat protein
VELKVKSTRNCFASTIAGRSRSTGGRAGGAGGAASRLFVRGSARTGGLAGAGASAGGWPPQATARTTRLTKRRTQESGCTVRSGRARLYHCAIAPQNGIFISHTHGDTRLAHAVRDLVDALFGNRVTVSYSSSKEEGGISPGKDWFRWIVDQVSGTSVAFVLLTPSSIQKPWVLWEAGAVAGAAYAAEKSADTARVIPLTFAITSSDVPSPFARMQIISGTDEADMMKLTEDMWSRFDLTKPEVAKAGRNQVAAVKSYVQSVETIMFTLPHVITEAAIQEWIGRFDALSSESRYSEVVVLENWLDVAFGRDAEDRLRPLDVRIHRRLGDLYAKAGKHSEAARQFHLARKLVPRDIFILRRLGKAYLDMNDVEEARKIVMEIEKLDPGAFRMNVENAALKARLFRASDDWEGARDVLKDAFENNPDSYYLGDLLGQALLKIGDIERAKEVYTRVRRILSGLREENVWSWATALTAAIVCDDEPAQMHAVARLHAMNPSRGDLETIERGVDGLAAALGRGDAVRGQLRGLA